MTIQQGSAPTYQTGPASWDTHPDRKGADSTPLGRIILGVFLGLFAWSAVMVVVFVLLAVLLFSRMEALFSDLVDQTGSTAVESASGVLYP